MTANDRRRWLYQDSPESGNGAFASSADARENDKVCPLKRPCWRAREQSELGGIETFAETPADGEVAPIPAVEGTATEPAVRFKAGLRCQSHRVEISSTPHVDLIGGGLGFPRRYEAIDIYEPAYIVIP